MQNSTASPHFSLMDHKVIKNILENGMGPGIINVVLFSNIDGRIIENAGKDEKVHSHAAVLANICNKYIEFGSVKFKNSQLNTLFITTDNLHYLAKPI